MVVKKTVFIFSIRWAQHKLNSAQNFPPYDYHMIFNCDVATHKLNVEDTLGKAVILVLILHTLYSSKTIKV